MSDRGSLSGRPLFSNASDSRLYVEPVEVVHRIERSVGRGLNTLLIGERGAGKTSLLQHLLFRARQKTSAPRTVYVDGSIARSTLDVVDLLRDELGIPPHVGENITASIRAVAKPRSLGVHEASLLLQRLAPVRDGPETVVLLDGVPSAEIAHTLFGRLRDELWGLPLTWVVAIDPPQQAPLLNPPADAFFETIAALDPLGREEQLLVLQLRLPDEWRSVAELVDEGTSRSPRQLLAAAREALVEKRPVGDVLEQQVRRQTLAASLGRSASMMYSELESLGRPAAASDEELLQRLGVTRERASQVLNKLERKGLLESFDEPSDRGRPRKLYRISPTVRTPQSG